MAEERDAKNVGESLTRLAWLLLAATILLRLAISAMLAANARYVMDELATVDYFNTFALGFYEQIDPVKTVLGIAFFGLGRLVTDGAVELMHVARAQGFLVSLTICWLVWKIGRRLGQDPLSATFAVAVLVSFTNFAERSFRIRTDSVSTLMALAAALVVVTSLGPARENPVRENPVRERSSQEKGWFRRSPLLAGCLLGLAFLVTQKALYFLAAAYFGCVLASSLKRKAETAGFLAWLSLGWFLSILAYSVAFGGFEFPKVFAMIFLSPVEFATAGRDVYPDIGQYLVETLTRNAIGFGLGLLGLASIVRRFGTASLGLRFVFGFGLAMTLFVFAHSQPWPYVFVMCQPLLAICAGVWVSRLGDRRRIAVLLALLPLGWTMPRGLELLEIDNVEQTVVIAQAESLLNEDDVYGDGLGMVPTRRRAGLADPWWDALGAQKLLIEAQDGQSETLNRLFAEGPKVWIVTYRTSNLGEVILPYLRESYVPVCPNVLLSGAMVTAGRETRFRNHWPGAYALYDAAGQRAETDILVNGRTRHGEFDLVAGTYSVRLPLYTGSERLFLLPAGLDLPDMLPAPGRPQPLFTDVYR